MLSQQPSSTLFSLLQLAALLPSLAHAACYWQNSTQAPDDPFSIATDDTAGFPDQDNSPCCGTGWTCLSDGVCYIEQSGSPFYYRGTCTDRSWDSQQCPGWCFAQNSNSSIPLAKCDTEQDWYCCPGDADCDCETGKNAVKLGGSQPTTVTVIGSTSWPGITSTTAPFTEQPLNTEGTTTSSGADTISTATTTSDSDSASSSTGTQAAASATGSDGLNVTASTDDGGTNVALAAGLGAGLGAAAVVIACLVFFLLRSRRKKHAALLNNENKDTGYSDDSNSGSEAPNTAATGYGSGGVYQYFDPKKHSQIPPEEMPAGSLSERVELDGHGGTVRQVNQDRVELGG